MVGEDTGDEWGKDCGNGGDWTKGDLIWCGLGGGYDTVCRSCLPV